MAKVKSSVFMIAILVNVVFIANGQSNNYCNIRCYEPEPHTMCLYKTDTLADSCGKVINKGLTREEKKEIVRVHNELRQRVARGLETRGSPGPQPAAKHMPDLKWDDELEMIAQRWANQCNYDHDQCRDVDRYPVGQNIGNSKGSSIDILNSVSKFIHKWYSEVEIYDASQVSSFRSGKNADGKPVGHYTQIVSSRTKTIGCGKIVYQTSDRRFKNMFVCNYGPSGNFLNEPVYVQV